MSRMLTASGLMFDLQNPRAKDVRLDDIVHALSNLCRFTGHTRHFYSVAQHSVLVASLLPPSLQFIGLMHDAHEAYIADLSSPAKAVLSGHREFERPVWAAVAERFDLPLELPAEVKRADMIALATERRDLMAYNPEPWPCLEGIEPCAGIIEPLPPREACYKWKLACSQIRGLL